MGLFNKALELEQKSNRGGLLNVAETLVNSVDTAKKKSSKSITSDTLTRLQGLSPDGRHADGVFDILTETFSISKGAILLLESTQRRFMPQAHIGFDRTTQNRLRIPETIAQEDEVFTTGNPIRLTGHARTSYKQFFSMREYGQLQALVLCPLVHNGDLFGIVLIAEAENLPDDEDCIVVMSSVAQFLYTEQEDVSAHMDPDVVIDVVDPVEQLDKLIATAHSREKAVIVFQITLAQAVDYLTQLSSHTEPYRIRQDIIRILSSLVSGIGLVIKKSSSTLLLAVTTRKTTSSKLFAHQITQAIRTFFKDADEKLPLVPDTSVRYPDDGETAATLLSRWE